MRKTSLHVREHSEVRDNIVFFPPKHNYKMYRLAEAKFELNQRPHFFIIALGLVIGSIISFFIGYHIEAQLVSYIFLSLIPLLLAYGLRKVYIHTLIKNLDE